MTLKEFQKQAERTFPSLNSIYHNLDHNNNLLTLGRLYYGNNIETTQPSYGILDLVHARIGILSETDELMDAIAKKDSVGVGEELTDKLWYLCNDLNTMLKAGYIDHVDFDTLISTKFDGTLKATDSPLQGSTLNYWFNAMIYNESKLLDQVKKLYAYNKPMNKDVYLKRVEYLIGAINNIAVSTKVDLNEYMDKVIIKLRNRYPEKFTSEAAINRDVEAERKILEDETAKN
jgi:hypothetical protein